MSPQSEGRPSTDRRPIDDGYVNKGTPRQQPYESQQQVGTNGYQTSDIPQQRFMGSAAGENNSLPPSPVGGRNGREREIDNTRSIPFRERSRNDGSTGGKTSTGTLRICGKCGEPLTGQFVRALGGTFHLECFKCRVCQRLHSPGYED